jgi:hypothetical protein
MPENGGIDNTGKKAKCKREGRVIIVRCRARRGKAVFDYGRLVR